MLTLLITSAPFILSAFDLLCVVHPVFCSWISRGCLEHCTRHIPLLLVDIVCHLLRTAWRVSFAQNSVALLDSKSKSSTLFWAKRDRLKLEVFLDKSRWNP
jgi:hypothetical protein